MGRRWDECPAWVPPHPVPGLVMEVELVEDCCVLATFGTTFGTSTLRVPALLLFSSSFVEFMLWESKGNVFLVGMASVNQESVSGEFYIGVVFYSC